MSSRPHTASMAPRELDAFSQEYRDCAIAVWAMGSLKPDATSALPLDTNLRIIQHLAELLACSVNGVATVQPVALRCADRKPAGLRGYPGEFWVSHENLCAIVANQVRSAHRAGFAGFVALVDDQDNGRHVRIAYGRDELQNAIGDMKVVLFELDELIRDANLTTLASQLLRTDAGDSMVRIHLLAGALCGLPGRPDKQFREFLQTTGRQHRVKAETVGGLRGALEQTLLRQFRQEFPAATRFNVVKAVATTRPVQAVTAPDNPPSPTTN